MGLNDSGGCFEQRSTGFDQVRGHELQALFLNVIHNASDVQIQALAVLDCLRFEDGGEHFAESFLELCAEQVYFQLGECQEQQHVYERVLLTSAFEVCQAEQGLVQYVQLSAVAGAHLYQDGVDDVDQL